MSGYLFKLGNSIITWKCKKQQTIALSLKEAKYMAYAVKKLLCIRQLLHSCCIRVILLAKSILISKLKYSLYCYLNKINKSKINNIKKIRGNKKL